MQINKPMEYKTSQTDVCLIGIPWDSTETGKSVKYGPLFIKEALKNLEGYDPETGKNPFETTRLSEREIEIVPGSWELTEAQIKSTIKAILNENSKILPIFLGGDHLITLGILKALKEKHEKITVIHFDAHKDTRKEWMGETHSHITWAHHAQELGIKLAQIGIRSWTKEEKPPEQIKTEGPIYVTIDLDVFDPGFAPDVGTPEPLGMSPKEFFEQFKKINFKNLIGMDIVECASDKVNTSTALLGAQIIKKTLCYKENQ